MNGSTEERVTVRVALVVNGRSEQLSVSPSDSLVDVLRERLGLFSCRETCGIGVCGTCTVLVDDRQVSACLTLAFTVDGARVETAEGLAEGHQLSAVQEAFVEEQAFQCSYCTPGFIMGTEAWRRACQAGDAGREDVEQHLVGHLCRCGCYRQILAAVDRVEG